MKKIISLFMSLTMFTTVLYPCQSAIAQEVKLDDILSTGQEVSEMCEEYDDEYSDVTEPTQVRDRLIVKTNDNIDEYGAVDSVYGFGYAFLQYADEESAQFAKAQYEKSGYTVDYDSVITASSTSISTSSNWNDEWAYEETDAASALDYYKLKVKPTINVAVIDSGINYNHELFKNRVVRTNTDFSAEASGDEMDKYGHGTSVAGAIAKSTPDNVKLYSYKVYDKDGRANASNAISAFEYIKNLSQKPDIINCSIIFSGLGTIVNELVDMGITVVAAAGNDGKEVPYDQQPAIFDSVITVAATSRSGGACDFSNYGSCVDIAAPGISVYTANSSGNNTYELASGTSLATPLVSAAAAYVLMENRSYTPEQVKQKIIDTATPFKKSSCYYGRYGAGIINYSNIMNGTRCKDVTSNYVSGAYRDNLSVELKCANTLVDIYYTTDGTLPTTEKGIKYTEPILLDDSARITAVAYARAGTPFHSKFSCFDYYILEENESEFVIEGSDYSGTIKAYLGNETNVVVPDIVNGFAPTKIGPNVFSDSDIESVVLPDTVTTIGENAFSNTGIKSVTANNIEFLNKQCFYNCNQLSDIDLSNVKEFLSESLFGCELLNQDLELLNVIEIYENGLAGTYFNTVKLPNCSTIGKNGFDGCQAKEIVLNSAATIGASAFNNCKNLETIYAPKTTGLEGFNGCSNLNLIFAPETESFEGSIPSDATIYCSHKLMSVNFLDEYKEYKYTFISPEYTPGLNEADRGGFTDRFIRVESDEFGVSKGGQIRTRDNGLRFGFDFDDNTVGFDFTKYAKNIDYGFVYTFDSYADKNDFQKNLSLRANKNNVYVKSADRRNVDGTVSTYNAVFTGIPSSHFDDEISARAYMCIDGMYFYSPVTSRSFSQVANAVLADEEIDQNTKSEVEQLIGKGA